MSIQAPVELAVRELCEIHGPAQVLIAVAKYIDTKALSTSADLGRDTLLERIADDVDKAGLEYDDAILGL